MIARNILANAIGGSWYAILSLAIIPVQIRVLGVDAYGLLAFVASLQIAFGIFDFGLTPTISRELATDDSPELEKSLPIVQGVFAVYVAIGVILGGSLVLASDWIVSRWLDVGDLAQADAKVALQFYGLAIMMRWPVSFLAGMLVGRGKFAALNVTKVIAVSVTLFGGAIVILITRSLESYAAWLAAAALIESILYVIVCIRLIPNLRFRPRFSRTVFIRIWRFVASVSVISMLGTILAQSDRIVLSKFVTVESLGYYSLASSILMGITLVQTFFTTALLPSFAASYDSGARQSLQGSYTRSSQLLVFICALPVFILTFFAEPLLTILTSSETARVAAQILPILAPAFLINASVSIPYIMALATNHTSIVLMVYGGAVVCYLPLLVVFIVRWGTLGAAAAWLILNVCYLFTLVPLVQRRIVGSSAIAWVGRNLFPFMAWGAVCFAAARLAQSRTNVESFWGVALVIGVASTIYILVGIKLLDPSIQQLLRHMVERVGPFGRVTVNRP